MLHNDPSADKVAGLSGVAIEPQENIYKIKSMERVNAI
jgi:hypothetical protein